MVRPRGYFAVFREGKVIRITHGHKAARELSPERAYRPFRTELDAEEFAAWWNYERPHWTERPTYSPTE